MKAGKKIRLDLHPRFKSSYGTVDSKNLKSVYLNISSWLTPKVEQENWDRVIRGLKRKVKLNVSSSLNNTKFRDDASIVDLDIRVSGLKPGKKSFMNCEITLFTKEHLEIKSTYTKNCVTNLIENTISSTFETNKFFTYQKSKK